MRKLSDHDVRAYDNAVARIDHHRKREMTRRTFLEASAVATGAALAAHFVPVTCTRT